MLPRLAFETTWRREVRGAWILSLPCDACTMHTGTHAHACVMHARAYSMPAFGVAKSGMFSLRVGFGVSSKNTDIMLLLLLAYAENGASFGEDRSWLSTSQIYGTEIEEDVAPRYQRA